jgi:hypothetical protein
MEPSLAIIVPAYKPRYLVRALESLTRQTMPRARLYVFDDASPHVIAPLVEATLAHVPARWTYHRFSENLGRQAPIAHFTRCIEATSEPWIWLFSDDDIAESTCLEAFACTLEESEAGHDVYCFDSLAIDGNDDVTGLHPSLPERESWKQFAYHFFAGHRTVPQQAMIFSRAAYQRIGGLVDFPLGWAADQATLMALAGANGIRRVAGARVHFRYSGDNLSSTNDRRIGGQKLQAAMRFIEWTLRRIETTPDAQFPLSDALLRRQAFAWFRQHLGALRVWYAPAQCRQTATFLAATAGESYLRALTRMARLDAAFVGNILRQHLMSDSR